MSTNLKGIASFVRHVEVIACNPATVNIAFAYSMTLTDEHDAGKQIPWTKSKLFLWAKDPISCQSKLPTPSDVRLLDATADTMQCCPWMPSCRNFTHSVKWPGFPRLPCKRPDGSFAHVSNTEVIFYVLQTILQFFSYARFRAQSSRFSSALSNLFNSSSHKTSSKSDLHSEKLIDNAIIESKSNLNCFIFGLYALAFETKLHGKKSTLPRTPKSDPNRLKCCWRD